MKDIAECTYEYAEYELYKDIMHSLRMKMLSCGTFNRSIHQTNCQSEM